MKAVKKTDVQTAGGLRIPEGLLQSWPTITTGSVVPDEAQHTGSHNLSRFGRHRETGLHVVIGMGEEGTLVFVFQVSCSPLVFQAVEQFHSAGPGAVQAEATLTKA